MGDCRLCGTPAGLLRSVHRECQERYDAAFAESIAMAQRAACGEGPPDTLDAELADIASRGHLEATRLEEAKVVGWERAVEHLLDDGRLSPREEAALVRYRDRLSLPTSLLDRNGAHARLVKAAVLRDVLDGRIPDRLDITGPLPFILQKGEKLVWAFPDTKYYEDRVRRQYVGGSHGFSFRIARGVYYRVGGFRGEPVESSERVHVDSGVAAVTTKHLYFAGGRKSLRIRHDKIVSLIPFEDGVGVHRDAASAKPQIFVTGDGWFTYNLLANINLLG